MERNGARILVCTYTCTIILISYLLPSMRDLGDGRLRLLRRCLSLWGFLWVCADWLLNNHLSTILYILLLDPKRWFEPVRNSLLVPYPYPYPLSHLFYIKVYPSGSKISCLFKCRAAKSAIDTYSNYLPKKHKKHTNGIKLASVSKLRLQATVSETYYSTDELNLLQYFPTTKSLHYQLTGRRKSQGNATSPQTTSHQLLILYMYIYNAGPNNSFMTRIPPHPFLSLTYCLTTNRAMSRCWVLHDAPCSH